MSRKKIKPAHLDAVLKILSDGVSYSADEIVKSMWRRWDIRTGTASVTARIRDLRKDKHGGYVIPCYKVDDVFYYRILP